MRNPEKPVRAAKAKISAKTARTAKPKAIKVAKAIKTAKALRPGAFKPLKVEVIPNGEAKQIREVAQMTGALQEKRRKSQRAQKGKVVRGVHPKSHGCLIARFTISPKLRKRHRVGVFATPGKTFKAKIRLSNASVIIADDLENGKNGSRGLAIKLMDAGRRVLVKDQGQNSQDFLMINTPEFAFGTVHDYHRVTQALMGDEAGVNGDAFFLPAQLFQLGVLDIKGKLRKAPADEPPQIAHLRQIFETNPFFANFSAADMAACLKSAQVAAKILATPVRNPLEIGYFTASPVRFGSRRIARFSVEPLDGPVPQAPITPEEAIALGPDYLAQAVADTMAKGAAITLRFRAQIMHPVELEGRSELIEDATVAWDPEEFQPVDLAKITIDPADQPKELVDACKADRFTPWHCLPAHEPLGGINRLRKPVYENSADNRS